MEISPSASFTARMFNRLIALLAGVRKINYSNYLYHRVKIEQLARLLPKDSRYFYDLYHFGNAGAETVGKIVAAALGPHLIR